jgi:two-component system KDP operon response regulator KdpE
VSVPSSEATEPNGAPRRILLLEDEAVNRSLVRAVLSRSSDPAVKSVQLVEATTIAEAKAVLDAGDVEIALLDVRVPDGSGLELARQLANGGRRRRPGIVIVSASVLASERDAAMQAGCDAFLAKPYHPAELIETVKRLLEGRESAS